MYDAELWRNRTQGNILKTNMESRFCHIGSLTFVLTLHAAATAAITVIIITTTATVVAATATTAQITAGGGAIAVPISVKTRATTPITTAATSMTAVHTEEAHITAKGRVGTTLSPVREAARGVEEDMWIAMTSRGEMIRITVSGKRGLSSVDSFGNCPFLRVKR